jgi:hypothetical protein
LSESIEARAELSYDNWFAFQEGRVVGGAEQGGALWGPESHGRRPVHVSGIGKSPEFLLLWASCTLETIEL